LYHILDLERPCNEVHFQALFNSYTLFEFLIHTSTMKQCRKHPRSLLSLEKAMQGINLINMHVKQLKNINQGEINYNRHWIKNSGLGEETNKISGIFQDQPAHKWRRPPRANRIRSHGQDAD